MVVVVHVCVPPLQLGWSRQQRWLAQQMLCACDSSNNHNTAVIKAEEEHSATGAFDQLRTF